MISNWLHSLRQRLSQSAAISRRRLERSKRRSVTLGLDMLEDRWVPAAATFPLVVSSFFDSAVYELNSSTGALESTLVAPNSQGILANPAGMAVGPDGNLYFSSQSLGDPSANSIVEYNVSSGALSTFIDSSVLNPIATANGDSTFAPAGLAFGPDGNLYVSLNGGQQASSGGAVVRFNITNTTGTLSYAGTFTTIDATGLAQPTEMTFGDTPSTLNTLYVSNSGGEIVPGDVIQIANADSATPKASTFIATGSGSLNYPAGLTWGTNGDLYVVDLAATASHDGQILQFSPTGAFLKDFTTPANSLLYQFPSAMVFNSNGFMLTANLGPTYPADFGGPGTDGSIYEFNSTSGALTQVLSGSSFPAQPVTLGGVNYEVTNISPSQLTLDAGITAPSVTAGNGYSINQGSSLNVHAIGIDSDGFQLSYSWSINGEDIFGQATGANPTITWAQLKSLGVTGDSSFDVQVMADDGHGNVVTSNPVTVTINKVPVDLNISGSTSVNQGAIYNLNLGTTTINGKTIQQWTINWGDGNTSAVTTGTSVQHIYANGPDFYTISATAINSADTEGASNVIEVDVQPVPPQLTIEGPSTVDEGETYILGLNAAVTNGHAIENWTINWGDGSAPQFVAGDPPSVTHVYADGPNHYTISATATTNVSTFKASDTISVSVEHVPPTLDISGPTSIVEGTVYTLQLSGSEVGNHTIKKWTIIWGDGSAAQTLTGNPTSVTHVFYAKSHDFTISARATDDVGTYAASATVVVDVQHLEPTLDFIGSSTATAGQAYILNLSGIEPLPEHKISEWTINWGDGTTTVVKGNPLSAKHIYVKQGNFNITVTATDDVGTYAASSESYDPNLGTFVYSNTLGVTVS